MAHQSLVGRLSLLALRGLTLLGAWCFVANVHCGETLPQAIEPATPLPASARPAERVTQGSRVSSVRHGVALMVPEGAWRVDDAREPDFVARKGDQEQNASELRLRVWHERTLADPKGCAARAVKETLFPELAVDARVDPLSERAIKVGPFEGWVRVYGPVPLTAPGQAVRKPTEGYVLASMSDDRRCLGLAWREQVPVGGFANGQLGAAQLGDVLAEVERRWIPTLSVRASALQGEKKVRP
jgi:hypothetical protein